MRILQLIGMAAIFAIGVRWAIREGSKPPPDEERQLILGYDEDGVPIIDQDCDVDKTLEMWQDMSRRARKLTD